MKSIQYRELQRNTPSGAHSVRYPQLVGVEVHRNGTPGRRTEGLNA